MLLVSTTYPSPYYKCIKTAKCADAFIPASSLWVLNDSIHAHDSSCSPAALGPDSVSGALLGAGWRCQGSGCPASQQLPANEEWESRRLLRGLFHTVSLAGLVWGWQGYPAHLCTSTCTSLLPFPVSLSPGITPRYIAEASDPCLRSAPRGCKLRQQAQLKTRRMG